MSIAPGAGFIETEDLNEMEHYIFFVGATFAVILFTASLWLLVVFPNFIAESVSCAASQDGRSATGAHGSDDEVPIRRCLPVCNTSKSSTPPAPSSASSTRCAYSPSPWTPSPRTHTSMPRREQPFGCATATASTNARFWTDVLFILAYFCALTSTAIAIMVCLLLSFQLSHILTPDPATTFNGERGRRAPRSPRIRQRSTPWHTLPQVLSPRRRLGDHRRRRRVPPASTARSVGLSLHALLIAFCRTALAVGRSGRATQHRAREDGLGGGGWRGCRDGHEGHVLANAICRATRIEDAR